MKTILFAVALLLIAIHGYTQSTFIKGFGGVNASEYVTDFKKVNANNFLIVGYTQNFGAGSNDIYVVCVNKDGTQVWAKTYGTSKSEKNAKCAIADDGSFVLMAETYDSTASTANSLLIIKCKQNGNIEWSKTFKSNSFLSLNAGNVIQAADGSYYVMADPTNLSYSDDYFMLLKLDSAGNRLWHKTINTLPQDYYKSSAITEMEDGSIAVAGKFSVGLLEGAGDAAFMVIDKAGNINTFKTIYCSTCDPAYESTNIFKLYSKNNQLYFIGNIAWAAKYFWLKAGRSTTTVNASTIQQSDFSMQYLVNNNLLQLPDRQLGNLQFLKDGSMLRTFRYFTGETGNYDMMLYKYDAEGRICSKYKVPKYDTTIKSREFVIADKSFETKEDFLSVNPVALTITDIHAETTECIGAAPGTAATKAIESITKPDNKNLFAYPNPAANTITISFTSSRQSKFAIAINSADGKTLHTLKVDALPGYNKIPVNIAALASGTYFIKLTGNNQQSILKFIKN